MNYLVERKGLENKVVEMATTCGNAINNQKKEEWQEFISFLEKDIKENFAYEIRKVINRIKAEIVYNVSATGMLEYSLRLTKDEYFNLKKFNHNICYYCVVTMFDEFLNRE